MRRWVGRTLLLRSVLLAGLLVVPASSGGATGAELRVLSADADGLQVELALSLPEIAPVESGDRRWDALRLPGFAGASRPGHPDVPFLARLLAVPPGARVEVEVLDEEHVELRGIELVPVPGQVAGSPGASDFVPDPAAYAADAFLPAQRVAAGYLGVLRGAPVYALRLYPFSYNPARGILRAHTRLRVRIRFLGGTSSRPVARVEDPSGRVLRSVLLNPEQADWSVRPRAGKPLDDGWYDPTRPWVKIFVEEDGLYIIDPTWLRSRTITDEIDPRSFRLFHLGEEQMIRVRGEEDGRFEEGDYLLFHGRFRRDDRDFGSLYGPRNIYWLTWGGRAGRRFVERSGAVTHGYPEQRSFRDTAHFEMDLKYDPLADAPDIERDHWFWNDPVRATKPDIPSSRTYPGELLDPSLDEERAARVRVSLHGASDLAHHTVVKLNDLHTLADTVWGAKGAGQVELFVEREISSSSLRAGTNRLLLQVFADQEKFDLVYMNWFALDYRRRYAARGGYLEFGQPPADGHRIAVTGLRDRRVQLVDVANGIRFTDFEVDSLDAGVRVTFEDRNALPALYVIADGQALKIPRGVVDSPSAWRRPANRADYLIIAHPLLLKAAGYLADHRRGSGLEVEVVSTDDLYDEFSHGLVDRQALSSFIHYAYHQWERRPTYVLLLGDDTYDYRGLYGVGVPAFVPSLYYQSRDRGRAPSDFLYALVDGDDLLPDMAIGRLAASDVEEAEQVVDKIVRYDREPEPGDWRRRVIYLANDHPRDIFTGPSDSLASRYTEPLGMSSIKVYSPDESPIPNVTGRRFLEALNDGALLLNFSGHGSAGTLQYVFSLHLPDWDYLSQVRNRRRLPLVLAFSCLNGMFVNPALEGLAEVFANMVDGGAIAYVSATATSYVFQNDLLGEGMFEQFFKKRSLAFGPVLNSAKSQLLAAHPAGKDGVLTMQLFGDPAQELALPRHPDYAPLALRVDPEPVFGQANVRVTAELGNTGLLAADSLEVVVLGRADGAARPETLFAAERPAFAATSEISFAWPVGPRRGAYRLQLILDPDDLVTELDEGNNRLDLELEILEPLLAEPVFPAPFAVVDSREFALVAAVPVVGGPFSCEFALAADPDFTPASILETALASPVEGAAVHHPGALEEERPYYWRVRLHGSSVTGAWSAGRSFLVSAAETAAWHQREGQLLTGAEEGLVLEGGDLVLSPEPLPFRPSSATRDTGFTVRGLEGAGVLCMDGTHLYAKRWYNDASTVYPGNDFFTRVGSGFNNSYQTANFGPLADSTTAGISATFHSDGYIYSENGRTFELERISPATGRLDTVEVPDGLLEWKTGRLVDGHSLITSDGRYIYNVSMSSEKGMRAEWSVRVFDPADGWRLVRQFTSPPTETGFTFEWTDGILASGRQLYFIEYGGGRRIRMVDAFDGRFLDEWRSDQEITRIITGQYDWVNNKVWLGDLLGSAIFRYAGLGRVDTAVVVSEAIGPAARWHWLRAAGGTSAEGYLAVDVLVPDGDGWEPLPGFVGLSPEVAVELGSLDASIHPRIRLRARLQGGHPHARLASWSVDFVPRPSLKLVRAEGKRQEGGLCIDLQVRNLSAFAVEDAWLIVERSDRAEAIGEYPLAPLGRGEIRSVRLDSLEVPPEGTRIFARVRTGQPDAEPADNHLEVLLLFGERALLRFQVWPDGHAFLSGDPLRPDQGLIIAAPGIADARLQLVADGAPVEPDSVLATPATEGLRVLYRPRLAPGVHRLQARLLRDGEDLGDREILFRVSSGLTIANALIYPHPVREQAHFTYVLSHEAEVEVEIYSLTGRLVRRLGPVRQVAGFQQLAWDSCDESGDPLASGAYLYRLRARSGEQHATLRSPLVVVR